MRIEASSASTVNRRVSLVAMLLAASFPTVAGGGEAAARVAAVTLGKPAVVAVSPPEYGQDPAGTWWGFFQFPDLWRGNDGSLSVAVNVGADSVAGKHEPTLFFFSRGGDRTWQVRGMIADGLDTSWGYGFGEQSLARMPDGDLLCVMRTKASNALAVAHHLAAARSADTGQTWQMLPPLAEFSVTPHLVALANGMVAVVYGRPGVHVKASAGSAGRSWSER